MFMKENPDGKKNYVVVLSFYIKMMKWITLQACSLENSIKKICFLFMANLTYLNRMGGGGSSPSSPWLHAWKYIDCPTKNYRNTIHYNEIAVIFCGTVCILYYTGNRLRLINPGLLFNLTFQQNTKNLKLMVLASLVGGKKLEEPMLKSYATTPHFFERIC